MKKNKITPRKLQIILIVGIVILIIGSAAGFYFANKFLSSFSTEVSHATSDSVASANNVQTLQAIKKELTQEQSAEQKAGEIVSPVGSYQSQVITDLDNYASRTGVSIVDYAFTAPTVGAAAAPAAAGVPAGTQTVTVTITSPVSYNSLLEFIRAIENNLPKMVISNISIGQASTGGSDMVSVNTLSIAVFTR